MAAQCGNLTAGRGDDAEEGGGPLFDLGLHIGDIACASVIALSVSLE